MSDLKRIEDFEEDRVFFEFLLLEGLERIGKMDNARYLARLKHEFDRMTGKKYVNYFLCNWDFIHDAKTKGISVGPCRGSAGASLAGYCLDITSIDPIKHDLLFTRFLSPIRRDAPDIDLDFQDDRRKEVYSYLMERYGETHCAKVATYSRFHPKIILLDIGRIFEIPKGEIAKISSLVIERSGGDARASFGLEDTFAEFAEAKEFEKKYPLAVDIAKRIEGGIRHKGSHAAAMVVAEKDLNQYAPINLIGGVTCLEWEKQLVEDMKLIKFDILGLKTLSIIQDALESAKVALPSDFDDPEVYENVFKNGDTEGCFQFTSPGMQKFIRTLNIKSFEELSDATTLYRPGALHCLEKNTLVDTQSGNKRICDLKATDKIKCYIKDGIFSRTEYKSLIRFGKTGNKKVFRITTERGEILATEKHKFLTKDGYKKLKDLEEDDEILMAVTDSETSFSKGTEPWNKNMKGFLSKERLGINNPNYKHGLSYGSVFRQTREVVKLKRCEVCNAKKNLEIHHIDKDRKNNKRENLKVLCKSCHAKEHNYEKIRDKKGRFKRI